jgi:uncharacterized ferritin-like protein (DUF455 family)
VPALGNRAAARGLGESLDRLAASLSADDPPALRRTLADTRRGAALLRAANASAIAAELDAIDLALDAAAGLTEPP